MSLDPAQTTHQADEEERKLLPAMLRGFANTCPACGNSALITSGLKVIDQCPSCNEPLYHHRADDLPAYLNIFIIGHVVVAAAMITMDLEIFNMWTIVVGACVLALAMALVLMRPLKGMVVGLQWALRMHGFGGHDD
ncbi:MAG: DUF983 domain-containing protein [Pseudomonadota bacterium]